MADPNLVEQEVFHGARRIEALEERRQYLELSCGEDRALRERVEALLCAHYVQGDFLDPSTAAGQAGFAEPMGDGRGTVVGPYTLLRPNGEGGMGSVFLAEQSQPVRRRVALKLLKPGLDSLRVIARFEAERHALALMDHPNIAKVHDAGTTPAGRPYFVMELVPGVPITRHCDEHRLAPRQRLELFVSVCRAVQHAHQKGIIHRDLKPSNVLVAMYDGTPVPKVIDFGVAKATGQGTAESADATEFGMVIGTLEYMSPEHAEPAQRDIDTRSDVYSLGVLLYELLTGTTPLQRKDLRKAAWMEMLRIIREDEPPKPSSRLGTTDELPSIAANRSLEPRKLSGLMRGDLDWIVMKSLEKDRTRRYETASGLARDVERYLNGKPVEAGSPGPAYRLRKFAWRHKAALVTMTGISLLVSVGAGVSIWQAVRATRAERSAIQERNLAMAEKERADSEAAVATAVNEFLQVDLLGQADVANQAAGVERNRDISMREVLDRAGMGIETRFQGKPRTEAAIRQTLGNAYRGIGEFAEAQKHLQRALELRKQHLGADHAETLRSIYFLAGVLTSRGDYEAAKPLYNQVLDYRRIALGDEQRDTLLCQNDLGVLYHYLGRFDDAEKLHSQTLDARRRTLGNEHLDTLETTGSLAAVLMSKGQYAQAEPLYQQARAGWRAKWGADHPHTLLATNGLASAYLALQRFDDAEPLLNEALVGYRKVRGADHPDTLAVLQNLAEIHEERGRFDEAEATYRQMLTARRSRQGADHPDTLRTMQNFGAFQFKRGRFDEAEGMFKQVLAAQRTKLGKDHPETITSMNNLGVLCRDRGRFGDAEPLFREAIAAAKTKLGLSHPNTCEIIDNLATLHSMQGTPHLAEPPLREVVACLKEQPGPGSANYGNQLGFLALNLLEQTKYADAEPFARDSLAIRITNGPDRWTTFYTKHLLGSALLGQKKYADAQPLLVQAYEGMKQREAKMPDSAKRYLTDALNRVVQLYDDWGKPAEAAEWRKRLADGTP